MTVLEMRDCGLYCPGGDFYIDPWKPVRRALITHAHGDHARTGSEAYLSHPITKALLRVRVGEEGAKETIEYGESVTLGEVKVSFHPAGHIPGSAQIRIEGKEGIWVASGDYKRISDGVSTPFEPVKCTVFITESTFGLPIFQWKDQEVVAQEILTWYRKNQEQGIRTVLLVYSLGKAQRVLKILEPFLPELWVHSSIATLNAALAPWLQFPNARELRPDSLRNVETTALILLPPMLEGSTLLSQLAPYSIGSASGWMAIRGMRRRRNMEFGAVLSDHADWNGLTTTIRETEAEKILVTHGYTEQFVQWIKSQGIDAAELSALFNGEES